MLYHRQCVISASIDPLQEALFKTIADAKYTCNQVQLILRTLEESKSDLCVLDATGNSFLLAALRRENNEEIAGFLYQFFKQKKLDAAIWTVPSCQRSALWFAARNGYAKIVKSMIAEYPHPNLFFVNTLIPDSVTPLALADKQGTTMLMVAAENGHVDVVKILLAEIKAANLNSVIDQSDKSGYSPLARACKNGHINVVAELLQNGARLDICTNHLESPILLATNNLHKDVVKLLLAQNPSASLLNELDRSGRTALYYAVVKGEAEIIAALLLAGASFALEKQRLFNLVLLPRNKVVDVLEYLNARGVFIGIKIPAAIKKMANTKMSWMTFLDKNPEFPHFTSEQMSHVKVHAKRALISANKADAVLKSNILRLVGAKFGLKALLDFTLNQTDYLDQIKLPDKLDELVSDKVKQRLAVVHVDEMDDELSSIQTVDHLDSIPELQQRVLAQIERLLCDGNNLCNEENTEDLVVEEDVRPDFLLNSNRIDIVALMDCIDKLHAELNHCYDSETWQYKRKGLFKLVIVILLLVACIVASILGALARVDNSGLSILFKFLKMMPAIFILTAGTLLVLKQYELENLLKRHQLLFDNKLEWPLRELTEQQFCGYQKAIHDLQALQQALTQDYPDFARQLNTILANADINIDAASKKLHAAKPLLEKLMPEMNLQRKSINWQMFKPASVAIAEEEEVVDMDETSGLLVV